MGTGESRRSSTEDTSRQKSETVAKKAAASSKPPVNSGTSFSHEAETPGHTSGSDGVDLSPAAYVPSDTALASAVNYIVPDVLLPDEKEFDITVDYRVQQGPLRGVWFRVRNGYVDFDRKGGSSNNVRIIVNYELPVL